MNNSTAIGLAVFFLVILVLILVFSAHRQKAQNEIKKFLFERFGAAQDLAAFLQSEGGQRFLADLSTQTSSPLRSAMGAVQKGIIVLLVGIGCVVASMVLNSHELSALGMVLSFVGLGFLLSAAATRRLAKKWGLLEKPSDDDRVRSSGK